MARAQGAVEEAQRHLERALEASGRGRLAEAALLYRAAARLLAQTGRVRSATVALDSLGQCLRRLNRSWEALEAYNELLRLDVGYVPAYLAKARIYLETQQPRNALETLELAQRFAPDQPERLELLSRAYLALGQPAEAAATLQRLLALRADRTYREALCMVLEARREQLERLNAPDSLQWALALELGRCYLALGRTEEALAYFQLATRRLGFEAFTGLAEAHLAQGDVAAARAALYQAVGLAARTADAAAAYRALADLFERAGQPAQAARMRQRALEQDLRQTVQRSASALRQSYEQELLWWQLEAGYGWWMPLQLAGPLRMRPAWASRQTYWSAQVTVRLLRSPLQAGLGYSQDLGPEWRYLFGSLGLNFTDPYEAFGWVLVPSVRYGIAPLDFEAFTYELHVLLGVRVLFVSLGGEFLLHRPLPREPGWRAGAGGFLRLHVN
ncbi:MAG: tetratricopeptide repeat protein [Bacteroidota bacterium]|nr:tetratricopeptide repeat protein [Bacteroidota bacterium]